MKIKLKYETEAEKTAVINGLSKGFRIIKIHNPKKIDKYFKLYIDIECKWGGEHEKTRNINNERSVYRNQYTS